ncbi:YceI family protein [Pelovirga terrestris]|nr:YceI family protein [Pelovirga terrestris]
MFRSLLMIPVFLLTFVAGSAAATTYMVDATHSQIHFSVNHLMFFKVRGTFNEFSGSVDVDPVAKTLTAAAATINTATVNTRDEKRDEHLRSDDFFDVANHPTISFTSKTVSGAGDNIRVVGDITIRGVTKEITLNGSFVGAMTDHMGNERAGFVATGEVNRKDFGLNWNRALETGGVVVGDTVEIGLEIAAVKQ